MLTATPNPTYRTYSLLLKDNVTSGTTILSTSKPYASQFSLICDCKIILWYAIGILAVWGVVWLVQTLLGSTQNIQRLFTGSPIHLDIMLAGYETLMLI